MDNTVTVRIRDVSSIFPWKRDVLLLGKCAGVLPMGIIEAGEKLSGIYKTEGYVRISSLNDVPAGDILTIAERVLECVEICKDCLMFPAEYVLSADTVYVSRDLRQAKLAYIPKESSADDESDAGAVLLFIYSLKRLTTENGRTYLDTLGAMLECRNIRFSGVIAFIEELKQEIKLCGIR